MSYNKCINSRLKIATFLIALRMHKISLCKYLEFKVIKEEKRKEKNSLGVLSALKIACILHCFASKLGWNIKLSS